MNDNSTQRSRVWFCHWSVDALSFLLNSLEFLLFIIYLLILNGNWKLKHGDDHASCCEICIKNVNLLPANN